MDKQTKEALKNEAREAGRELGQRSAEQVKKRLLPRIWRWVSKIAARRAKR